MLLKKQFYFEQLTIYNILFLGTILAPHFLSWLLGFHHKTMAMLRFDPGKAGYEARMRPLSNAKPN